MRLNKFLSQYTNLSRRGADVAISSRRVSVDGTIASLGQIVNDDECIKLDNNIVERLAIAENQLIMLNKPTGHIVSQKGQGSPTIYQLLPPNYANFIAIGRLDKDTTGLILLTNNGELAQSLMHPGRGKTKTYEVTIARNLRSSDITRLKAPIQLEDGPSVFTFVKSLGANKIQVSLYQGRNRQIRRAFAALNLNIISLHRTRFGEYHLDDLKPGSFRETSIYNEEFKTHQ